MIFLTFNNTTSTNMFGLTAIIFLQQWHGIITCVSLGHLHTFNSFIAIEVKLTNKLNKLITVYFVFGLNSKMT